MNTAIAKRKSMLPGFIIISGVLGIAALLAIFSGVPLSIVAGSFQFNVLVILIVMELFTNLVVDTGIMQHLAIKIAIKSKGSGRLVALFFGVLMFFISAFLNNITAVMVILPIVFVLLKALDVDKRYVYIFFSIILALSNTGGASSPIGDFPAIVIMTSGITTFLGYLLRAMPVFIITTAALLAFWVTRIERPKDGASRLLAVDLLKSRHKHSQVDYFTLVPLLLVLVMMFLAWSFVPQEIAPPETIALFGYALAAVFCAARGKHVELRIDFKAVITIAAFLFLAGVVDATGILTQIAEVLQSNITDPKLLLIIIMLMTSIMAGLFSAGPAAAAMMPVIVNLCNTSLAGFSDWVAIAYAASICAGSSLFLWSATAGFIVSSKVEEARLGDSGGIHWGIGEYFKYGIFNYVIQLAIAILLMVVIL